MQKISGIKKYVGSRTFFITTKEKSNALFVRHIVQFPIAHPIVHEIDQKLYRSKRLMWFLFPKFLFSIHKANTTSLKPPNIHKLQTPCYSYQVICDIYWEH